MQTPISFPEQDENTSPAHFVGWLKKPGEWVEAGEALYEIEIDKATIEIASSASGYLAELTGREGDVLSPGQPVGTLLDRLPVASQGNSFS